MNEYGISGFRFLEQKPISMKYITFSNSWLTIQNWEEMPENSLQN